MMELNKDIEQLFKQGIAAQNKVIKEYDQKINVLRKERSKQVSILRQKEKAFLLWKGEYKSRKNKKQKQ